MKNIKKLFVSSLILTPLAFIPNCVRNEKVENFSLTDLDKQIDNKEFVELNKLLAKTYNHLNYEYTWKTNKVLTVKDMLTWISSYESIDEGSKSVVLQNLKRLKSIDVEKNLITNNYNNFSEESAKDLSYATIWAENYKKWVKLEIELMELKLKEIEKRLEMLEIIKERAIDLKNKGLR